MTIVVYVCEKPSAGNHPGVFVVEDDDIAYTAVSVEAMEEYFRIKKNREANISGDLPKKRKGIRFISAAGARGDYLIFALLGEYGTPISYLIICPDGKVITDIPTISAALDEVRALEERRSNSSPDSTRGHLPRPPRN